MTLGSDALGHQALGSNGGSSNVVSLGGNFVATGQAATLVDTRVASAGAFALTGVSASFTIGFAVAPAVFSEVTIDASLQWSGLKIVVPAVDRTGTSDNIVQRIKQVIPKRWFKWLASIRDAILGGVSDSAAWCYSLVKYARAQTRLFTAYGVWLDIFAYDFLGLYIQRRGTSDDAFRAVIRATILQERVTRAGMANAITTVTGKQPWIFEPWNTYDTGGYSGKGATCGSFGYGVGQGGYGNMNLPCQTFMLVHKGAGAGVPGIGGYGSSLDGYGSGAGEYVGPQTEESGITQQMIYDLINNTKPTGTTCWTQVVV